MPEYAELKSVTLSCRREDLLHFTCELDEIADATESLAAILFLMQSHDDVDEHSRSALRLLSAWTHDLKIRSGRAAREYAEKFGFS